MNVGDTFISPTEPLARFPEREMRVIGVSITDGAHWVDAVPVRPSPSDLYWHSTYVLGTDGRPMGPVDVSWDKVFGEGGAA